MFQIIKFCGITSAQLASLDVFLASEENVGPLVRYGGWMDNWETTRDGKCYRPYAKRLMVRDEEISGLYMVEIRVEILWRHEWMGSITEFWVPRYVMEGIHTALGIYPSDWNKFGVPCFEKQGRSASAKVS